MVNGMDHADLATSGLLLDSELARLASAAGDTGALARMSMQEVQQFLTHAPADTLRDGFDEVCAILEGLERAGAGWRLWAGLLGNANLGPQWLALHGLNIAANGPNSGLRFRDLVDSEAEQLQVRPELLQALLNRVATPGTFDAYWPHTAGPHSAAGLGMPSVDWWRLVDAAIFYQDHARAVDMEVSVLIADRRSEQEFCDDQEFVRRTWSAVMRSYRRGLLPGMLDPVPLPHYIRDELRVEVPYDRACGALVTHWCAYEWPQLTSVALMADANWSRTLPGSQYLMRELAALVPGAPVFGEQVASLASWVVRAVPADANLSDAVGLTRDAMSVGQQATTGHPTAVALPAARSWPAGPARTSR